MKKGFALAVVLIIVLLVSILGLAVLVYKQGFVKSGSDRNKLQENVSVSTSPAPNVSLAPSAILSIDNLITYNVPKNWKRDNNQPIGYLRFYSPDYSTTTDGGFVVSGFNLMIKRELGIFSMEKDFNYLDGLEGLLNKKKINVNGVEGLDYLWNAKYWYRREVHIYKKDFQLIIEADFLNLETEKKYSEEIDDFIASINFK